LRQSGISSFQLRTGDKIADGVYPLAQTTELIE
jgi:hypothetical protein